MMPRFSTPLLSTVCLLVALITVVAQSRIAVAVEPAATQPSDRAALEKQFAELMTNATMVGQYTIEGSDSAPHEDRYHLIRAVKADGDNWAITSRIEYKGIALPITLTIPVKWAGDTPVIAVTNQVIPGFGTFTARVLFYGGHYVGTWSGGKGHAGTMWGRIDHGDATTRPATKSARDQ